jgi:oxygen-independent coproporphyrinogen-3 oxidase
MVAKQDFEPLDADTSAGLFELTQERTAQAGIPAYEISNHARVGAESRHNLAYWRYREYAGVGPGAHGRRLGLRTVRHKKPENFLAAVRRNGHGLVEEEALTRDEAAQEALVMGLRLAEGIDPAALAARLGVERLVDEAAVDRLVVHGLLERDAATLRTTPAGRLLLDSILAEIAA